MSAERIPRIPDPAEENIARVQAGGSPASEEQKGSLGEIVRDSSLAERFLGQYSQRDDQGKITVLSESTKRDIVELGADYNTHKSVKELLDLMRTMRGVAALDEAAERHMTALDDFVHFIALHDASYQKELYDTRVAAERAKKLESEAPDESILQWTADDDAQYRLAVVAEPTDNSDDTPAVSPPKTFDSSVVNDRPSQLPRDKQSRRKNLGKH